MSIKDQIQFIVQKLEFFRERLGGNPKQVLTPFARAKLDFLRAIQGYKSDQKELRNYDTRNVHVIKLEHQMKKSIQTAELRLKQMNKLFESDQKKGKDSHQQRQQLKRCTELYSILKGIDPQEELEDKRGLRLQDIMARPFKPREPSEEDLQNEKRDQQFIGMIKQEDKKVDDMLDQLINEIDNLGVKVRNISDGISKVEQKQGNVGTQLNKVNKDIERKNVQLKQLIEHFKTNNCCLTIFLTLLFMGLIVVLINVALKLTKK